MEVKKYRVKVNNDVYEIEIEDISGSESVAPVADGQSTAGGNSAGTSHETARDIAPAVNATSGPGTQVTSPMPGNILSVNVKEGDAVQKGDVLMILEAMKMENEIMASQDGTIGSVNVAAGSQVESGTLLCTIK